MKHIQIPSGSLIPAIVQHAHTMQVLMLGYMNQEALTQTIETGLVTFFSRSKNRIWVKGETSGNTLALVQIAEDCDHDTLLVTAIPAGPTCHAGTATCFGESTAKGFLYQLEQVIDQRLAGDGEQSYTRSLAEKGVSKVAQKVGEEAVELVIEAMQNNDSAFKGEAADLLFHLLILLRTRDIRLTDIEEVLKGRMK